MKDKQTKHIVNWNLITLIATIAVVLLGIILNWNQRQIDILEKELELASSEIENLRSQTDPSWHIKFNEQKSYYISELAQKEKILIQKSKDLDSIIGSSITIGNATLGLLNMPGIEKVSVSHLSKRKLDSIYLSYYLLIRAYESLDSIQKSQIKAIEGAYESQKDVTRLLHEAIEEQKIIDKNRIEIVEIYKSALKWLFYPLIFTSLLAVISSYLAFKQYRNKKSSKKR